MGSSDTSDTTQVRGTVYNVSGEAMYEYHIDDLRTATILIIIFTVLFVFFTFWWHKAVLSVISVLALCSTLFYIYACSTHKVILETTDQTLLVTEKVLWFSDYIVYEYPIKFIIGATDCFIGDRRFDKDTYTTIPVTMVDRYALEDFLAKVGERLWPYGK